MQEWGLDLLMELEAKERGERAVDEIKRALLTSKPEMARTLYPEWFVDEIGEGREERRRAVAQKAAEIDLADTTGEMFFEGDVSREQAEQVLQQMLAHPEGTLTGMEFDGASGI